MAVLSEQLQLTYPETKESFIAKAALLVRVAIELHNPDDIEAERQALAETGELFDAQALSDALIGFPEPALRKLGRIGLELYPTDDTLPPEITARQLAPLWDAVATL